MAMTWRSRTMAALAGLTTLLLSTPLWAPLPGLPNCTSGIPQYISFLGPASQSAAVGSAAFGSVFVVYDTANRPLQNVAVTFTTPATAPSAIFGTKDASMGFVPSPTPRMTTVTTGSDCYGSTPLWVADPVPGSFTIDMRVDSNPSVGAQVPASVVSAPASNLFQTSGQQIAGPGEAITAGAAVNWSMTNAGGPLAGAPVTFTAPATGPTATFANGAHSITVPTDMFGNASATATAGAQPGPFHIQASVAGVGTVNAGDIVVAGPSEIQILTPATSVYGSPMSGNAKLSMPWFPCGFPSAGIVDPSWQFQVDGQAIASRTTLQGSGCLNGGSFDASLIGWMPPLLPGTHQLTFEFTPSAKVASALATQTVVVSPSWQGFSPTGAMVQLGVTDPGDAFGNGRCSAVSASTGMAGDSGFPPSGPPGVQLPLAIVRFAATGCSWGNDLGAPVGPLVQRVVLGGDSDLAEGTVAWAYGPTPDNTQAHWYALRTGITGHFAVFEVTSQGLGDGTGAAALSLHPTIALGQPVFSAIPGTFQDLWWGGPQENGWGMSVMQHADTLFSVLYVYDAQGDPRWLVMPGGQWNAARTAYSGALYRPHGAPYTAYTPSSFAPGSAVGEATLAFDSLDTFTLRYTIDGVSGSKRLQRQRFGPTSPFGSVSHDDMWWGGPSQNGWGLALAQQNASLFGVLFTYDTSGNPVWFPASALSDPGLSSPLYLTHGSPWIGVPYDASKLTARNVGFLSLSFAGPNSGGTLRYQVDGKSIVIPIERQPF